MQKRPLGKTGLQLSILGIGGFHLVETPQAEVDFILNRYLDEGGNYIETAADYGDGLSENKIASALASRRNDFILASKCAKRSQAEARLSIERSLRNLQTDYLDILYMHAVQKPGELQQILGPGGALEAARQARDEGKVRYIGITGHGEAAVLIEAVRAYPFDVLMTGFNYFDRFNFPAVEDELLPDCLRKGIGSIGMKALADGYLYRSVEPAIRYSLSLPIAALVLGINTREYLRKDLEIVRDFRPMNAGEKERWYCEAPELGAYVCRQCKKCDEPDSLKPSGIFLLEGEYDRQMVDSSIPDPGQFALIERLKHWFDQRGQAIEKYRHLGRKVNVTLDYTALNPKCPYGVDIDRKLKLAHSKLGQNGYIF